MKIWPLIGLIDRIRQARALAKSLKRADLKRKLEAEAKARLDRILADAKLGK